MKRVEGKIALVTGGGQGIGAATARKLAEHGATVLIGDLAQEPGASLAQELNGSFYCFDASCPKRWQEVADTIEQTYGRLDILFNNAGISGMSETLGPQDPEHIRYDSWQRVHRINLDSVFLGCQQAIRLMKSHGGSIINMSSRSGLVGVPGASAYASSKAAIRNHTKSVALYCAEKEYHIRCNSIHPGAILTPLWDDMLAKDPHAHDQGVDAVASGIPLGFMGTPDDVAYAVLYLGSDESKYLTGIELSIDGGLTAGSPSAPKKYEETQTSSGSTE